MRRQPTKPGLPRPAEDGVRLQKVLAERGLGSRRLVEAWIEAGRIELNGRRAKLGDRAKPGDRIMLDGQALADPGGATRVRTRVLLYHKPVGELVTRSDPQGRPTIFERLPALESRRWAAVGRLDFNTSGLLLLTDSGQLAHRLMHPSFGLQREYLARAQGVLAENQLERLRGGVELDGVRAAFERIEPLPGKGNGANRWFRVVLGEGRNREVMRLFEAVGARVGRLVRVRYGTTRLPRDLPAGEWLELDAATVAALARHTPSQTPPRFTRGPKIG